jgi:plasmid stability protein
MLNITIHLDEALEAKLQTCASQHGRSIEDEARYILSCALAENAPEPGNLFDTIRRHIDLLGGVEINIPPRGPLREPPKFEE